MKQKRGVFIPIVGGNEKWFNISLSNGYELRLSALYWDKVVSPIFSDHPASIMYNPSYIADVQELVSLGVAEAPVLTRKPGLNTKSWARDDKKIVAAQSDIIKNIITRGEDDWSILDGPALTAETLLKDTSALNEYDLLHLYLRDALPLPPPDAPLESIVAFRDRRREELDRVSVELGRLSATYVGTAPSAIAIPRALRDLNAALSDVRRVYNEKWSNRFFKSLRASFMSEGVLPAAAFHYFNMPLDKAFAIGAGVAVVRSTYSSIVGKPKSDSPYSVLFDLESIR